ncbi:hypothetical protein RvY_04193 [Ramazzottius varieornatus]|uniref:Uncharacterized protein n=1 Tax=Ramazzottius varieornatus TaxID=947166 RepID=A0A1D1V0U5_RAMVA|nr:hypothetical protein RvY_04193 [Ramazzottius varieornatus]
MSRPQISQDKTPAPVTSESRMAVSLSPCIKHASAGQMDHLHHNSVNLFCPKPEACRMYIPPLLELAAIQLQLVLYAAKRCTRLSNGSQPVKRSCFIFANLLSHSKKIGSVFICCEQLDLLYCALVY